MNRTFIRAVSAVLAMLLLLPAFAACGKTRMPEKQTLTNVYRATEIQHPGDSENSHIQDFKLDGDLIRFTVYSYDPETYEGTETMYTVDLNGENLTDVTPPKEEPAEDDKDTAGKPTKNEQNFYTVSEVDLPDGTKWRAECHWSSDPITYEYKEEYVLLHLAADGTEITRLTGEDLWGELSEDEYAYINRMIPVDADTILVEGNTALYFIADEGQNIREISVVEYLDTGYFENFFQSKGSFYFLHYEWEGSGTYSLVPLDVAAGKLAEPIPLSDLGDIYSSFPGDDYYTFYYMNQEAVYGYDVATNTVTELMNFLNSDMNYSIAYNLKIISPEKFVTYGYDSLTEKQAMYVLTRVPDEEIEPRYIITLGCLGDSWSVRNEAIRFNRQSDEYRITLKTYEIEYPSGGDYVYEDLIADAVTRLNNDMIAGTGPDILLTNAYMPVDSYIAKGLFVDLYSYIDADETLSREDFLPNVLKALEVNGGLYEAVPGFTVRTLAGKKEIVGDRTKWTPAEFTAFVQSLPEGMEVFSEMTRSNALDMFLSAAYEEYIDADTGKCSFDSAGFAQILTFLSTLPEELDERRYDDQNYWQEYQYRFRDNKTALETVYLSSFNSIASLFSYTFYTDEISFVGYPTEGANGGVLTTGEVSFAISSKSPLKDGAWDFVRYFLTEEYQDGQYYFPLRRASLDKQMETALKEAEEQRKRYEDRLEQMQQMEQDAVIETPETAVPETTVPDMAVPHTEEAAETAAPAETTASVETEAAADTEIVVEDVIQGGIAVLPERPIMMEEQFFLTQETAQEIYDYITSLDRVQRQNAAVMNIIKEDAAAFFAGKKSVQDTVKLIQNRVSTYVAENR